MQTIPVDTARIGSMIAIKVEPDLDRELKQRANRDGEPIWAIECLHRPEQTGDFAPRAGVEIVKIHGDKPDVQPMEEVEFFGLTARHWSMEGRSGISLSAESAKVKASAGLPNLKDK